MDQITRRNILMSGAAGLAASVVGANAAEPAAAPKEPAGDAIKLGFIGVGGRGHGVLQSMLKVPGQQVVAICDISKENLDRGIATVEKAQGKAPQGYSDGPDAYKKLLERKDIDAIVTATPCFEHARIMLDTLAAGKHIYAEKPLGITVKQCNDCVAAAEANKNLVVQVGFQWMASPRFIDTINRIHKGEIGDLIEGRFFRHNIGWLKGWFSHRDQSGDWMLEQACHEFNIMNWVANATPLKAYGMGRSDLYRDEDPTRNVTDYYAAIIEYPKNFIVHYAQGWISADYFGEFGQKAIGTKGCIEIGGGHITMRNQKPQEIKAPAGDDTLAAVKAFITSIREGKPAIAPVSNGRNASFVGLMVRKAVYERREVTWEEMLKTC